MKPVVNLYNLGRLPYSKALEIQQVLFNRLKGEISPAAPGQGGHQLAGKSLRGSHVGPTESIGNSLILVEHEPVYTIGIRSKQYDEKYATRLKDILAENKISADFVQTNRGGLITFHGPGQLVAYPIIQLTDFKKSIPNRSVRVYVHLLEATIIDTLAQVGLRGAHTVPEYPGVWVGNGERKIAFVGISCKRFVTMHGISINCDCDLSWFEHIASCGIEDKKITSVRKEILTLREQKAFKVRHVEDRVPGSGALSEVEFSLDSGIGDGSDMRHSPMGDAEYFPSWSATKLTDNSGSRDATTSTADLSESSSVDHISKAFCSAFSKHFNCNLRKEPRTSIADGLLQ